MSKKYFYKEDAEICYPLESIKDIIAFDGLKEKEVFLAQRIVGGDHAWCSEYGAPILRADNDCGKDCIYYKPRNGKSGMCAHQGYGYEPIKKVLIKTKRQ